MNMKKYTLYLLAILFVASSPVSFAQNDSILLPINTIIDLGLENGYTEGPPCGIPCSHIYDDSGNFLECLSPCCNCNELYRSDLINVPRIIKQPQIETDTIIVQLKEPTSVFDGQLKLRISAIEEDHRCPADVQCIWAGNAKIKLELISHQNKKHHFVLNSNERFSTDTIIEGVRINLIDLQPERKSNSTIADGDYKATIVISKIATSEVSLKNDIDKIPDLFFDETGISENNIALTQNDFISGCVGAGNGKRIVLNSIMFNERKNTQLISLSFGGKRLYTKLYYLDLTNNVIVKIVEDK